MSATKQSTAYYLTLSDWAKFMDEARQLMVSFMQTREYENAVINGIGLDGTVHWPSSGMMPACVKRKLS